MASKNQNCKKSPSHDHLAQEGGELSGSAATPVVAANK